jgi:Na+-driven multidrug efflux pump
MTVVLRRLGKISVDDETDGKVQLFSWNLLGKIAVVAIPSILQQSFISVGNIVLQGVINGFGPSVMAGYSAAIKLNNLVITSLTTIGNGISNYVSQNIGAGKMDRVKQGFCAGIKLVWMLCIPLVLLYWFGGRYLLYLFMKDITGRAIDTGLMFLRIVSPFYFIVAVKLVADGVLRGAALMGRFMIATFTDLVLRVILALVFSVPLGSSGIWCAWPLGWVIGMVLSVLFYRNGPWKKEE